MIDAKITIVCSHGKNLSKYLQTYLQTKGVSSHAVGIHFKNQATARKIRNAKTIICAHPDIKEVVDEQFDLSDKHVICLEVNETPDTTGSSKHLTGELWLEHQQNHVYPELERQIKKHLAKLV